VLAGGLAGGLVAVLAAVLVGVLALACVLVLAVLAVSLEPQPARAIPAATRKPGRSPKLNRRCLIMIRRMLAERPAHGAKGVFGVVDVDEELCRFGLDQAEYHVFYRDAA
jgi:hypothetical protein